MGVAAEVADHLLGPAEWSLGIDDPFLAVQGFGNASKVDAAELQLPFLDEAAQRIEQLAAEQTGKDFDRKQETPLRAQPSSVVSTQSTAGHDAVQVGAWRCARRTDVRKASMARITLSCCDVNVWLCRYASP